MGLFAEGVKRSLKAYRHFPVDIFADILSPVIAILLASYWLYFGSLGHYRPEELFLYTLASHLIMLLHIYPAYTIRNLIVDGTYQLYLLLPGDPALFLVGQQVGKNLLSFAVASLILVSLAGPKALYFVSMALLASIFYIFLGISLGYVGAWIYTVWGLNSLIVYVPALIFGGSFIPLDLLPEPIRALSFFLPYRYLHYDLVGILFDRPYNPLPLLLWIGVAAALERALRKRLIRRLESWGG